MATQHREKEGKQINEQLAKGNNLVVYGPSGSGKTFIITHVAKHFTNYAIADCSHSNSISAILQKILECKRVVIHKTGVSTDFLVSRVKEVVKTKFILVLDNFDELQDKSEVLFLLLGIDRLVIVIIANSIEFMKLLDMKVRSRLVPAIVEFKRYSYAEMFSILEGNEMVKTIAAVISKGDCRIALKVLDAIKGESNSLSTLKVLDELGL